MNQQTDRNSKTVDERLHDLKIDHTLTLQQLAAKNAEILELKDDLARCHYHIAGLHRREIEASDKIWRADNKLIMKGQRGPGDPPDETGLMKIKVKKKTRGETRVYTGEEDNKVNLGFITIIVLIVTIILMMTL
jgi:hypothetical protein